MNGAWNTVSAQRYTSGERELYGINSENQNRQKEGRMPEAAPVFAEITASELRGSRGRVIAGIKTGAVEVGIYIRADSAAEAALCWGLRDAE